MRNNKRDYGHNADKNIMNLMETIRIEANNIETYIRISADSGINGDFEKAEQFARKALQINSSDGRVKYYLACALRDQGKIDEASIEMDEALVLVRKAAVKGTGAESNWKWFPLFGWNKHVEDDARALRAFILRRRTINNITKIKKRFKISTTSLEKIDKTGNK